jgi:hypothetical protein
MSHERYCEKKEKRVYIQQFQDEDPTRGVYILNSDSLATLESLVINYVSAARVSLQVVCRLSVPGQWPLLVCP